MYNTYNREWLEQYRRNPRQSNMLYKDYANNQPLQAQAATMPTYNPMMNNAYGQAEQQGMQAGRSSAQEQLNSYRQYLPPAMQNMPFPQLLQQFNDLDRRRNAMNSIKEKWTTYFNK